MKRFGLAGLPGSGKTELFRFLTGVEEEEVSRSRAFNQEVISLPDPRLELLAREFKSDRKRPFSLEIIDPPGVIGTEEVKGKGGTHHVMGELRTADGLILCINAHRQTGEEAVLELETIKDHLIEQDLRVLETRLDSISDDLSSARTRVEQQDLEEEQEILRSFRDRLQEGNLPRDIELTADQRRNISGLGLFSRKPTVVVFSLSEPGEAPDLRQASNDLYPGSPSYAVAVEVERELLELSPSERKELLSSYRLDETHRDQIREGLIASMDGIFFFTADEKEVQVHLVEQGTSAREAAGEIHSDMKDRFVKAEVFNCSDLKEVGSLAGLRDQGLLRTRGADYTVQEGDVLQIRFSA